MPKKQPPLTTAQSANSRTEKHRLSLIFGKRASLHGNSAGEGTGSSSAPPLTNGATTAGAENAAYVPGEMKLLEGEPAAAGNTTTATASEQQQQQRPTTRASNESESQQSVRSRVGSVKKRLSLLGMHGVGSIGKKGRGVGQHEAVKEEE